MELQRRLTATGFLFQAKEWAAWIIHGKPSNLGGREGFVGQKDIYLSRRRMKRLKRGTRRQHLLKKSSGPKIRVHPLPPGEGGVLALEETGEVTLPGNYSGRAASKAL